MEKIKKTLQVEPEVIKFILMGIKTNKQQLEKLGKKMDKKINKIQKEVENTGKELKTLKKMDKKRDPACEAGKKMMKKTKK